MAKIKLSEEEQSLQKQGFQIKEMVSQPGWEEVLKPWLETKIRNSWVDPRSFKDDKEYSYAMKTAWALAQAADEILEFIAKVQEEAEELTKKEQGKIPDKLRESMS